MSVTIDRGWFVSSVLPAEKPQLPFPPDISDASRNSFMPEGICPCDTSAAIDLVFWLSDIADV